MIRFLRKLANDRRGNMLVIAGAAMPLLVGAAGLATDTIQWTLWKRELQRAADSGAIAGVYTRINTDTEEAVDGAVNVDLAKYGGVALIDDSTNIELLGDDGDKKHQVRVTLEVQKKLPFSSMFMSSPPVIRAVSTAAGVPGGAEYCVIALDTTVTKTGLEVAGNSHLDINDCSMIANSRHPSKAASNGASSANGGQGSEVHAKSIAAGGGVMYSSSWDVVDYDPNSPIIVDPFGPDGQHPLPNPRSTDCTKSITIDGSKDIDRSATDVAGDVVCINNVDNKGVPNGLTVQKHLTLGSARYILNGGNLTMNSNNASLACTHCTIILTNFTNPASTGNFQLTGGTLNLSAPVDEGTYKGIALYQDRRATDDGTNSANHIRGNDSAAVTGVIYTPSRSILYNGTSGLTSVCMQVVGMRVTFSGTSQITTSNECGDDGLDVIEGGIRVRLVA